jgi:hypothetical protein
LLEWRLCHIPIGGARLASLCALRIVREDVNPVSDQVDVTEHMFKWSPAKPLPPVDRAEPALVPRTIARYPDEETLRLAWWSNRSSFHTLIALGFQLDGSLLGAPGASIATIRDSAQYGLSTHPAIFHSATGHQGLTPRLPNKALPPYTSLPTRPRPSRYSKWASASPQANHFCTGETSFQLFSPMLQLMCEATS